MSLEDRFAIEQMLSRYAFLHDSHQGHLVADEIFTEDALLDYGTGLLRGREAIHEFFTSFSGIAATAHIYSNYIITIDGDRASSLAQLQAWHWLDKPNRDLCAPADITSIGGSQDEWHRTPKGWRISSRVGMQYGIAVGVAPPGMRPVLEGIAGRTPRWPA